MASTRSASPLGSAAVACGAPSVHGTPSVHGAATAACGAAIASDHATTGGAAVQRLVVSRE